MYFNDSKKAVTQLNGTVINGSQISVEFARTDAYHQKSHGRILMQLPVLYVCLCVLVNACTLLCIRVGLFSFMLFMYSLIYRKHCDPCW